MTVSYDVIAFTLIPWYGQWLQIVPWMFMVAGLTLVLYSRLYLVIIDPPLRRILLPIILTIVIGTNVLVYTLIFVCTALELDSSHGTSAYVAAWRLQLLSPIEEIILAGLYIFFFVKFLKDTKHPEESQFRKRTF